MGLGGLAAAVLTPLSVPPYRTKAAVSGPTSTGVPSRARPASHEIAPLSIRTQPCEQRGAQRIREQGARAAVDGHAPGTAAELEEHRRVRGQVQCPGTEHTGALANPLADREQAVRCGRARRADDGTEATHAPPRPEDRDRPASRGDAHAPWRRAQAHAVGGQPGGRRVGSRRQAHAQPAPPAHPRGEHEQADRPAAPVGGRLEQADPPSGGPGADGRGNHELGRPGAFGGRAQRRGIAGRGRRRRRHHGEHDQRGDDAREQSHTCVIGRRPRALEPITLP